MPADVDHDPPTRPQMLGAGTNFAFWNIARRLRHVPANDNRCCLRLGSDVLRMLGHRSYEAHRAAQSFRRHDEDAMSRLAGIRRDMPAYINQARTEIAQQEALLKADRDHDPTAGDHAWDSEELRDTLGRA